MAHTWVIEAFDFTPYLHISSPVKRCGKSRVFDCFKLLCAKPWAVVSITEAVMFRKIEQEAPTLLLDEVDAIFTAKKGDDGKEALRALLNAGFERRATVPRCAGQITRLRNSGFFAQRHWPGLVNSRIRWRPLHSDHHGATKAGRSHREVPCDGRPNSRQTDSRSVAGMGPKAERH